MRCPLQGFLANCVDRTTNGVSDCPQRASLCNDTVYFNYMTEQCPKTCNRTCPPGAILANTNCNDKTASDGTTDCPQRASLCHDTFYYDYMTDQCPKTCGRCPTTATCK
ncbi:unnamed protein product [Enterobius vermicularis]|uniref:ShKT domain-containing protein n=1 Tax=Enterobius vermicularis TaxID=51028 RepID=A0A0N4UU85_ENTVE|nr:unnamed protein product [Enterobius vermicularis]